MCSNFDSNDVLCSVMNAGLSDHEAVLFGVSYNSHSNFKKRGHRLGRILSTSNFNRFHQLCCQVDWGSVLRAREPLKVFHNNLLREFNIVFPLRKIKHRCSKPWFTKGLKVSSANLRSLHLIRKFTSSEYFFNYFSIYIF